MKPILILIFCATSSVLLAQSPMTYLDDNQTHLCGPITIEDLSSKDYKKWYDENYDAIALSDKSNEWKSNLEDSKVDIYLGTWCGDSRKWVPRFIKLWDDLGLDRQQLNFIALYNGDEKYKQGPNGEEKGKNVHRVPTFIFQKNGAEFARIVEKPVTDLETDIAQIALGYPSAPSYKAATYMIEMFDNNSKEEIEKDFRKHLNAAYRLAGKSSELNTLGYVFLRAGKVDEALLTFRFNTRFFSYNPNVYDSYGEVLAIKGDTKLAITNYEKVLEIDPENKNAKEQLEKLRGEG